jgi:hypothetical protein
MYDIITKQIPHTVHSINFIVAPCILKIHRVLHTNKCTNCISYINLSSSIGTTTLVGFRSAQQSLSILSSKVFTECRCQRHVKPPTCRRTRDLERSNFCHRRPPASEATLANPAAEGGTMGEKWPRNFAESINTWFYLETIRAPWWWYAMCYRNM